MKLNPLRKIRKLVHRSFLYRWYAESVLAEKCFQLGGSKYSYVLHPHNYTWTNERAVELSIAQKALDRHAGQQVLEVGNVTRHYFATAHDVVDKYEQGDDLINEDIVEFETDKKYGLVMAISTLEHVGWDRDRTEAKKIPEAVESMKALLNPGGELMVTVPIGFNRYLDEFIDEGSLGFTKHRFLQRVSAANEWEEADWEQVKGSQYNTPFNNANAIMIASYQRAA